MPRGKQTKISFIIDNQTGCWNWDGKSHIGIGYARIMNKGIKILVHRFFWELVNGKIPDGYELDHLCRNTKCINPQHLEVVTHKENVRRGNVLKIGQEVIDAIRKDKNKTNLELAKLYNIDNSYVGMIKKRIWRN